MIKNCKIKETSKKYKIIGRKELSQVIWNFKKKKKKKKIYIYIYIY